MKIEMKYDVGNEVWFIHEGKAYFGTIKQIFFEGAIHERGLKTLELNYEVWHYKNIKGKSWAHFQESELFASKSELLDSL